MGERVISVILFGKGWEYILFVREMECFKCIHEDDVMFVGLKDNYVFFEMNDTFITWVPIPCKAVFGNISISVYA